LLVQLFAVSSGVYFYKDCRENFCGPCPQLRGLRSAREHSKLSRGIYHLLRPSSILHLLTYLYFVNKKLDYKVSPRDRISKALSATAHCRNLTSRDHHRQRRPPPSINAINNIPSPSPRRHREPQKITNPPILPVTTRFPSCHSAVSALLDTRRKTKHTTE
jgi:hypothetical protein